MHTRTRAFTYVEVMIAFVILGLLAAILIPVLGLRRSEQPAAPATFPSSVVSRTVLPYSTTMGTHGYVVVSFRHDNHLWVWIEPVDRSATTMVHHPDCPCLKP